MSQILAEDNNWTIFFHSDCIFSDETLEVSDEKWGDYDYNVDKKRCELGLKFRLPTYNYTTKNILFKEKSGGMKYREAVSYFKKIATKFNEIALDDYILSGMPVIKNTRIPISLILYCLKDEMSIEEICDTYHLNSEDVERAMEFTIKLLDAPFRDDEE